MCGKGGGQVQIFAERAGLKHGLRMIEISLEISRDEGHQNYLFLNSRFKYLVATGELIGILGSSEFSYGKPSYSSRSHREQAW